MLYDTQEEARAAYRRSPADFFQRYHLACDNERDLISPDWQWYATRYHYNLVENGIIDLLRESGSSPTGRATLDVGAGTGHWIRFHRDVLEAATVTAVDFSAVAVARLTSEFGGNPAIEVRHGDVGAGDPGFTGEFELVTAIGVLFHLVDDDAWERAVGHLVAALRPGGLAIVGGEFGECTADLGVMRRVRSRARWQALLARLGAEVVGERRFEWFGNQSDRGLKNNLLAFRPTGS